MSQLSRLIRSKITQKYNAQLVREQEQRRQRVAVGPMRQYEQDVISEVTFRSGENGSISHNDSESYITTETGNQINTPISSIFNELARYNYHMLKNNRTANRRTSVYKIYVTCEISLDDGQPWEIRFPLPVSIVSNIHNLGRMLLENVEQFKDKVADELHFKYDEQFVLHNISAITLRRYPTSVDYGSYKIDWKSLLPGFYLPKVYIPENKDNNCFMECLKFAGYPLTKKQSGLVINNVDDLIKSKLKNIRLLVMTKNNSERTNKAKYNYEEIYLSEIDKNIAEDNQVKIYNILILKPYYIKLLNDVDYDEFEEDENFGCSVDHCAYLLKIRNCPNCLRQKCENNCPINESFNVETKERLIFDKEFMTCQGKLQKAKSYTRFFCVYDIETDTSDKLNGHKLVIGNLKLIDCGVYNENNLNECEVIQDYFFTNNNEFCESLMKCYKFVSDNYNKYCTLQEFYNAGFSREVQTLKINGHEVCFLCERLLTEENPKLKEPRTIVDHHDHSGNFGIVYKCHNDCNLLENGSRNLPVIAFNHSYDLFGGQDENNEILFKSIISKLCTKKMFTPAIVGSSFQKIKSLTLKPKMHFKKEFSDNEMYSCPSIRFIDFRNFIASSLEKIGESNKHNFPLLKKFFPNESERFYELSCMKGLFPYKILNNETYNNLDEIPSIEDFRNDLIDEALPEKDYERVLETYEVLKTSNFGKNYKNKSFKLLTDWYLH